MARGLLHLWFTQSNGKEIMKITPIAVAVAAAMFSLSAVANEQSKDKQAQGAQPPMSQEQKASSGGMSASGGASAPSSSAASSSSEQPKAATSSSEPSKGGVSASGEAKSSGKAESQAQSSQGQNPELIKQVQTKLNEQGHDVGQADGKMGQRTQTGIKAFQTSKGMKATGQLDQQTITALGVSESASAGGSAAAKTEGSAAAGGSAAVKSDDKAQTSAGSGASSAPAAKTEGTPPAEGSSAVKKDNTGQASSTEPKKQ